MRTKEEILKEETKRTLNIVEGSPLHDAIMLAMDIYAKQELSKLHQPTVMDIVCNSPCCKGVPKHEVKTKIEFYCDECFYGTNL